MHYDFLISRAAYASITVAFTIICAKIVGWYMTDSATILASLTDSLLDITASVINCIVVKYSLLPPDDKHRFGHGKAEDLAVFAQSSFFGLSGVLIIIISIKKLLYPEHLVHTNIGIGVMVFSIAVTIILLLYQSYVISKTRSNIIKSDHVHYVADVWTNCATIASLYLAGKFHSKIIDPIFAILIAVYILYSAGKLVAKAFHNLMDHEFNETEKAKLRKIILGHPHIKGYHDLKTRYAGHKPFIQFHIELDKNMPLHKSHKIVEEIESQICQAFDGAEIIIHQDPEDADEHKQFHH